MVSHAVGRVVARFAGDRRQASLVIALAAVLGLNGADSATVSATTDQLERAFRVGNTGIGLLVSAVSLVAMLGTLPIGILTDRTRRTRLLAASVVVWSIAVGVSGAATSYTWLLLSRLALGVASATTGPTVSSLVGDYFPAEDRGRIYGLILGGELAGTGVGFVLSGDISSMLSWRYAFWWLVLPGLLLAWRVFRLPEPERGGQPRLARARPAGTGLAARAARRARIEPDPALVLRTDPTRRSVCWATRYVLRVRTNVIVIITSALGYFFFSGLRSFAIIYATGHYGLAKPVASTLLLVVGVGALAGVFAGGRVADRALRRGHVTARILVPAVCLLAAGPVLAPAIATTSIGIALPLLTVGAALLAAPNAPLDAARLDIMHPRLWGRAEAVRTVLRSLGEAVAPAAFGYVSEYLLPGLQTTFLVFLVPLLLAGLLALPALRTYPRDVATATASVDAISGGSGAKQPAEDGR
jgi:predicted MFS family arabinose efflux permease